ncbi:MAG: hypothetical protein WEA09_03865 [Gemmatimonadota bacterium]
MKRVVLMAGLVSPIFLVACLSIPIPGRSSDGEASTLGWEVVAQKQEPNLLFSADRRRCEVDPDRFQEIRQGQRVLCRWR